MLKVDTYLFFDGTCAEAMRYYERNCPKNEHPVPPLTAA